MSRKRPGRAGVFALVAGLLVAVACSGGGSASGGNEGRGVLAGTDTSLAAVELADVHFDTFDGRSIPMAEITEEQLLSLRDRIPPLSAPRYDPAGAGGWLTVGDLVLGFVTAEGTPYAYPARILNAHEIVNDELDGQPVLVTYCPLCRSGVVYSREHEGRLLTFGNTSALYQSDLVMFDRQTFSYWFQVAGEAIVGELTGARLTPLPSVMTTWAEWLTLHPDTLVLSRDTGFGRTYAGDGFGGIEVYLNSGNFPFPVDRSLVGDELQPSALVLGLESGEAARVYALGQLGDAAINDLVGTTPIVVLAQALGPVAIAYDPVVDGQRLTFAFREDAFVDEETGSRWSLGGEAVAGPLAGARLMPLASRTAFWYSYATAFSHATVYNPD